MTHKDKKISALGFVEYGMHPLICDPIVLHFIPELKDKKFLDCGCGKGTYGYLVKASRDIGKGEMIGIDSNSNVLKFARSHKIYTTLFHKKFPPLPLKDKSVDCVLCAEVVEHLERKEGEKLLQEIDRICKGTSVITTPNIFFQNPSACGEDVHKSLWTVQDFKKFGYKVYGVGFRTVLRNQDKLYPLKLALFYGLTPFTFFIPSLSGFLICVKKF